MKAVASGDDSEFYEIQRDVMLGRISANPIHVIAREVLTEAFNYLADPPALEEGQRVVVKPEDERTKEESSQWLLTLKAMAEAVEESPSFLHKAAEGLLQKFAAGSGDSAVYQSAEFDRHDIVNPMNELLPLGLYYSRSPQLTLEKLKEFIGDTEKRIGTADARYFEEWIFEAYKVAYQDLAEEIAQESGRIDTGKTPRER